MIGKRKDLDFGLNVVIFELYFSMHKEGDEIYGAPELHGN